MEKSKPDYKKIYGDIINMRYPGKKKECERILNKLKISDIDVIKLNLIIFGKSNEETDIFNQQHKSYDKSSIFEILEYQKKNRLNDTEAARYFRMSRNTLAKWKRLFLV